MITYISSEKMADVFIETVFGFLTVYTRRQILGATTKATVTVTVMSPISK